MPGGDVADRFPAGLAPVRYRQVGAHVAPGSEQAGAKRVQHDPLDRHRRTRNDQAGGQGEGGGRRIARHGDEGSGQGLSPLQRDDPALAHLFDTYLGAEGAQHPLGVVAALFRLGHRGDALGVQSGQQYGRLDLGRGHGLHIVDRRQRPAGQGDRQPILGGPPVEPGAHVGQRAGDALHRPPSQGGVAVEGRRQRIARRRPHQQANTGAGVAAVDHRGGRLEAPRPFDPPAPLADPFDLGAEGLDRPGGGQDVVALQKALDLGHARGHAAQDHRTVGHGLVARRPHRSGEGVRTAGGQLGRHFHPLQAGLSKGPRGRRERQLLTAAPRGGKGPPRIQPVEGSKRGQSRTGRQTGLPELPG